jgi:hypothetical protein
MVNRTTSSQDAKSGAECILHQHDRYGQPSVIVRIPGASNDKNEAEQVIVLGAHLDSINRNVSIPHLLFDEETRAPGADDDGT